jgi:RTX calcium-binding nonapeptide repeat (4 copies)
MLAERSGALIPVTRSGRARKPLRRKMLIIVGVASVALLALVAGSARAAPRTSLNHEGVLLHSPGNGALFTIGDSIGFRWETTWYHTNPSTLHFFIGTTPSSADVVHQHFECPGSTAPSCPTTVTYEKFSPGTYYWGVDHEFPGVVTKRSDRWSFTVTADQHVRLLGPPNGVTVSTMDRISFGWATDWFTTASASTLHFFVGTGGAAENVLHEHYTCPASNSPSCETRRYVDSLPAGTYVWGVAHELPGVSQRTSPRWSFTVVEPRVRLTPRPPPKLPAPPPRPTRRGPAGVAILGSTLSYRGNARANVVDVVKVGRSLLLTQDGGRLKVGRGCQRLDRRSAKCSMRRVRTFFANMGAGDDSVAATIPVPSTLLGGAGSDHLEGGPRGDIVTGGAGHDTVDGAGGGDRIYGEGTDVLLGGSGDDALFARTSEDARVEGGEGSDYLAGGPENTVLTGGDGNDYLDGSGGSDVLLGGSGIDVLIGGDGNDQLLGARKDLATVSAVGDDAVDLIYCGGSEDVIDGLDETQQIDFSCEHAQTSFVGGLCGCYRARAHAIVRRAGATPYVTVQVETSPQAKLETFNVKLTFLGANGKPVAPDKTVPVRGQESRSFRKLNLPKALRKAVADIVG